MPRLNFLLFITCATLAQADVRLPALISDHMMLQRQMPVRIWGWADPGEKIVVTFQQQTAETTAGANGKWQAFLKPLGTGAAADLQVAGKNTVTVHDVLVGEVWVSSGQSNMEWPISKTNNAEQEIAASNHPNLRFFLVKKAVADQPAEDVQGAWVVSSPETIKPQLAIAYFFAREISEKQGIPVAVINSYWGGTPAQSWTTLGTLQGDAALKFITDDWQATLERFPQAQEKYEAALAKWKETKTGNAPGKPAGPGHQNTPAGLYNAMIAPLTPYAIRGVIWYQGESNASATHAYAYRRLFSDMIEDWRHAWGEGSFPFYFVQLANYNTNGWWPVLRESQTEALALKNTAMAVAIDVGNPKDIHPTDKQTVGHRLALPARALVYGENVVYSGPVFRQMSVEASQARLWFDSVGAGLATRADADLSGFEVAGADGTFVPAVATIDGATVLVSNPMVKQPVQVRYGWADNPAANLINKDGLPASPFRNMPSRDK